MTTRTFADERAAWSGLRTMSVGDLRLESGQVLPGVTVAYETWGTLAADGGNAVLVEHALTGDSHVIGDAGPEHPTPGWWEGLIGPGAPLDTDRYFVVATNVLGGCRGTTGPSSLAPDGKAWGSRFPRITIRDQVRAEARVADRLGVTSWRGVLGGSMGGMRAAEWAATFPTRVDTAIVIASTGAASAEQIAWASVQNQAIRSDPSWAGGDYYDTGSAPTVGMSIARQIAQITYRSEPELADRFGNRFMSAIDPARRDVRDRGEGRELYEVESYLQHHGEKLVARFDAGSFIVLNEAMSSHDLGAGRGGMAAALADFTGQLVVVSVDSDRLYPPAQSQSLVEARPGARHEQISSPHGHDSFLIEREQVGEIIRAALRRRHGLNGRRHSGRVVTTSPALTRARATG